MWKKSEFFPAAQCLAAYFRSFLSHWFAPQERVMKFLTEKDGEEAWKAFFDSHLQEKLFEERRWTEKKLSNRKREVESWIVEIQQEWRLREKAQRNMVFTIELQIHLLL